MSPFSPRFLLVFSKSAMSPFSPYVPVFSVVPFFSPYFPVFSLYYVPVFSLYYVPVFSVSPFSSAMSPFSPAMSPFSPAMSPFSPADAFIHRPGPSMGIGADFSAVMRPGRATVPGRSGRFINTGRPSVRPRAKSGRPAAPARTEPRRFVASARSRGRSLRHSVREWPRLLALHDQSPRLGPDAQPVWRASGPWVDEMVVVDTGSVDETPGIVKSFGGRLCSTSPWCDDFSAARNESLRHARGDWLFWMDSDDTIPAECGKHLRGLIDRPVAAERGWGFRHASALSRRRRGRRSRDGCDRRRPASSSATARTCGSTDRIHEQILPAIRRARGARWPWTEALCRPLGLGSEPRAGAEAAARPAIARTGKPAERPEHPFTLFNPGDDPRPARGSPRAADYLRQDPPPVEESSTCTQGGVSALLAYAEMRLNHNDAALEVCRRGRAMFPKDVVSLAVPQRGCCSTSWAGSTRR